MTLPCCNIIVDVEVGDLPQKFLNPNILLGCQIWTKSAKKPQPLSFINGLQNFT